MSEYLWVVEWKDKGQWEPTLDVAFTLEDIGKKVKYIRRAYKGTRVKLRTSRYARFAGKKP
jgi:hypothetical protein